MPDPNDNVVEAELSGGSPQQPRKQVILMDPTVAAMMVQQLTQSGIIAQNNFITVQKVVDYDYLENKRMVTLDEAIGVREVSAQTTPGGPAKA